MIKLSREKAGNNRSTQSANHDYFIVETGQEIDTVKPEIRSQDRIRDNDVQYAYVPVHPNTNNNDSVQRVETISVIHYEDLILLR